MIIKRVTRRRAKLELMTLLNEVLSVETKLSVCQTFRLDHYSHMSDVQTLAMLCSVFRAQAPPADSYSLYGHHPSRSSVFAPHHSRYVSLSSVPPASSSIRAEEEFQL